MSLTATTLSVAATKTDRRVKLTAVTGLVAGMYLRINDEFALVTVVEGYFADLQRGIHGTIAKDHAILSKAVYGYPYDFAVPVEPHIYTYGVAGKITRAAGIHRLAGGSALAMTLSAPTADEEGMTLLLINTSAYAHNITLDSGTFNNEVLSPKVTLTGAIGNFVEIMAVNSAWVILDSKNVTVPSSSASSSASSSPSTSVSSSVSSSASSSASSSPSSSVSSSASSSPSSSASTSASTSASSSASSSPSAT